MPLRRTPSLILTVLTFSAGTALADPNTDPMALLRRRGPQPPSQPADAGVPTQSTPTNPGVPGTVSTTPPISAVPLRAGESPGDRLAEARTKIDEADYEAAIGLLMGLHSVQNVPPAIAVQASLVETNALVALRYNDAAVQACKHAVVMANYDPNVAKDESPPVRAVCQPAAELARTEWVSERSLGATNVVITPGAVAWTPVRVVVHFEGNVTGLTTQAEVKIGEDPPRIVELQNTGTADRILNLDANDAKPGAEVSVTPLVSDAFGMLVRASEATKKSIPTDEAAVRFALGSDEGPLKIDGRATGQIVEVGETVPLEPGAHSLEVRTPRGLTSTAQVTLHRGEVATLTLHSEATVSAREVFKWTSTGAAVISLGIGAVFQSRASADAHELENYAHMTNLQTGLPSVRYEDVQPTVQSLQTNQIVGGVLLGVGGAFAAVAAGLWLAPDGKAAERPSAAPAVSASAGPQGASAELRWSF